MATVKEATEETVIVVEGVIFRCPRGLTDYLKVIRWCLTMSNTTAWERKQRRREVVRLKSQGLNAEEIGEELGWDASTIRRDLQRIEDELAKWDDKETLGRELRQALRHTLDHEYDDLRRAEREGDERAKHRAKQSMRSTVETLKKIEDDLVGDSSSDGGSNWLDELDEESRDVLISEGGAEVQALLEGE